MRSLTRAFLALAFSLTSTFTYAQTSTGTIVGRITDEHEAAVSGASVQATNAAIGFVREGASDGAGTYRLAGLPVGVYQIRVQSEGFTTAERRTVVVTAGRPITIDVTVRVGTVSDAVVVRAEPPLIDQQSSALGEVVDLQRIQSLPLNGRQFANLAALVPGVGLGFHSDIAKNAQYSPQISGGNGRNVNYVVDGGDDNDDVNGGLMQQFPLEAIQEFELLTHRVSAEHGRSSGAVLSVVTKSGTNDPHGSGFGLFRDDSLNGQTFTERLNGVDKQPYSRAQFGGSFGGPIVRNRLHYFAAYERTSQDTNQVVNTAMFADQNGVHEIPFRQNLFTGKVTAHMRPEHHLAFRVGVERSSQVTGAGPKFAPSTWHYGHNTFSSINASHNWIAGAAALNELVVQYADATIDIPRTTSGPSIATFDGMTRGGSTIAPQKTQQRKWHIRDDFSWTSSRLGGLVHQFKAGGSWIHEPRLFLATTQGNSGLITVTEDRVDAPVIMVQVLGGNLEGSLPMDMYGVHLQDDWRVSSRLTLNLGVRWDYVAGQPIDQSASLNFQALQAAGRAGRFRGTILEDFGTESRTDHDNIQPRFGAVFDVRGDGRDVIRGGWGIYTDFGYIASNASTAVFDARGGGGTTLLVMSATGIMKPDGTPFRITDPISVLEPQNTVRGTPRFGEVISPLLEQPYTRQANIGWAHAMGGAAVVSADYVHVDGRDLNMKVRPNVVVDGQRFLAGLDIQPPNSMNFRAALSDGRSRYDALIVALRRRLQGGVDVTASYTLASATSTIGTAADEPAQNLIQNIRDPWGPVQDAPSYRADSRHQVSISGIVQVPGGVQVAPIFYLRSALPVHTTSGGDPNGDGIQNDKSALAYRFIDVDAAGTPTYEANGPCETVLCSRRAGFAQLNLRVSRAFRLAGGVRLEAIGEMFNVLNANNPSHALTQIRTSATFMKPNGYAGDAGQPEQRVGQIGLRLTF